MSFAQSLKALRIERGLTQTQLAEAMNMSKSAISMYECGKREPELEVLTLFADFFGVDLNVLTGHTPSLVNEDSELTDYLEALRSRSEMRMLFSVTKNASKEDVEKAVKIIEALRGAD